MADRERNRPDAHDPLRLEATTRNPFCIDVEFESDPQTVERLRQRIEQWWRQPG